MEPSGAVRLHQPANAATDPYGTTVLPVLPTRQRPPCPMFGTIYSANPSCPAPKGSRSGAAVHFITSRTLGWGGACRRPRACPTGRAATAIKARIGHTVQGAPAHMLIKLLKKEADQRPPSATRELGHAAAPPLAPAPNPWIDSWFDVLCLAGTAHYYRLLFPEIPTRLPNNASIPSPVAAARRRNVILARTV